MRSTVWFDRKDLSPRGVEDPAGIEASYQQVRPFLLGTE
jgi:hypothetical protein